MPTNSFRIKNSSEECAIFGSQKNEKLAQGLYGTVEKIGNDRVVKKIKFTQPENELSRAEVIKSFKGEVEAMQLLRLSDLAPKVHNALQCGDIGYIVMDFVKGQSLGDYLKTRNGFLLAEEITIILERIRAMHDNGVVHGDLHPGNIIITRQKAIGGLKIEFIDFGFFWLGYNPIYDFVYFAWNLISARKQMGLAADAKYTKAVYSLVQDFVGEQIPPYNAKKSPFEYGPF